MEKIYYDACTLSYDWDVHKEILDNKKTSKIAIISHLAVGEAFCSTYHKKGLEAAQSLFGLIESMKKYCVLDIVQNDEIDEILAEITDNFSRLKLTDKIHIATAIKNECSKLKTLDDDMIGLPDEQKGKLNRIAKKFSKGLSIEGVQFLKPKPKKKR